MLIDLLESSKAIGLCLMGKFDMTSVNSDKPMQPPFKPRNSKWCSVSSSTILEYSCG